MKLDIRYYRTPTGKIPVKDFLGTYATQKPNEQKKLLKIHEVIKLAAEKGGIPGGKFSSDLDGYPFPKLTIPEGNLEIRIPYFAHQGKSLILLDAFKKPDRYEKGGARKISKLEQQKYDEANKHYKDYLNNQSNYEDYP